jgi:hypothetical protein
LANAIGKSVYVVVGRPRGFNALSRGNRQSRIAGIFGGLIYCIGLDSGRVNVGLRKEIFEDADPAGEGVNIFFGIGLALVVMKNKCTLVVVELAIETLWFASIALKDGSHEVSERAVKTSSSVYILLSCGLYSLGTQQTCVYVSPAQRRQPGHHRDFQ